MSCGVNDPTWTFTWYKDDQKLTKSTSLILDEKGSKLTIGSIVRNHHGSYACKAHLTLRGVRSELSIKLYVKVYGEFHGLCSSQLVNLNINTIISFFSRKFT